jgi:hypothetical protein
MRTSVLRLCACSLALLAGAGHARAEIVELRDGGLLKVVARSVRGDVVVLALAGGGEIALPRVHVRAFHPDEVPGQPARTRAASVPLSSPEAPRAAAPSLEAALRLRIGTPATKSSAGVDAVLARYRVAN